MTSQTDSFDAHGYSFSMAYNDAGQPTSLTYSDGEVLGTGYNAYGWLNQVQTTPSGGSPFTLATSLTYTGNAGAAMQPTSASIANGMYTYTASFDNDLRLTTDSLTTASATLYSATRGYDAVGNVISEDTTLTAGTDNQVFCYNFASHAPLSHILPRTKTPWRCAHDTHRQGVRSLALLGQFLLVGLDDLLLHGGGDLLIRR